MAFVTFLVVANIIAVKLVAIGGWVLPAGIIAYPFTFLISDTIAELYGRKVASRIIWLGFAMSLAMVVLVYVSRLLPEAGFWENQEAYDTILGSVPRIVLGSMVAYLVSQHHDIIAFHFWKRLTNGRYLWLRNNASTVVSQAIDTVLFVTIAFGGTLPADVIWNMLGTQYAAKLLIAAADTPFVYALVAFYRRMNFVAPQLDPAASPAGD
jgi:uncharacterized integral membrane protein (TIGR00697 family)